MGEKGEETQRCTLIIEPKGGLTRRTIGSAPSTVFRPSTLHENRVRGTSTLLRALRHSFLHRSKRTSLRGPVNVTRTCLDTILHAVLRIPAHRQLRFLCLGLPRDYLLALASRAAVSSSPRPNGAGLNLHPTVVCLEAEPQLLGNLQPPCCDQRRHCLLCCSWLLDSC